MEANARYLIYVSINTFYGTFAFLSLQVEVGIKDSTLISGCCRDFIMRFHVVYFSFCVLVSLYVAYYNLATMSPWKPTMRVTQRKSSSRNFYDIEGESRQQQQQLTNETITETERNTESSQNKQGLQFRNKLKELSSAENKIPQKNAPRTNLIILSSGRGGSSFLGAMFDSNPQIMYWFEPLHTVNREVFKFHSLRGRKEPKYYNEICNNVIDSFFKCNFSKITNTTLSKLSESIFRYRSKSLTSGYLCPGRRSRCPPFSNTLLSKACNSYKHTVIKILTSRVPNKTITSLQKLFQQQNRYDVRLIHLVRDPRAVVYSMVNSVEWINRTYLNQDFRSHVHGICDTIEQNIRMGLLYPPPWLRNRFKLIRFEDFAVNTVNIAQELYKYAGFDWSLRVEKWISAHNRPPNNAKERDAYSLYRNASDVIDNWKNAPQDFIRVIQDVCGELMAMLGYDRWVK